MPIRGIAGKASSVLLRCSVLEPYRMMSNTVISNFKEPAVTIFFNGLVWLQTKASKFHTAVSCLIFHNLHRWPTISTAYRSTIYHQIDYQLHTLPFINLTYCNLKCKMIYEISWRTVLRGKKVSSKLTVLWRKRSLPQVQFKNEVLKKRQ